jgi:hypothetical protein
MFLSDFHVFRALKESVGSRQLEQDEQMQQYVAIPPLSSGSFCHMQLGLGSP